MKLIAISFKRYIKYVKLQPASPKKKKKEDPNERIRNEGGEVNN